VADSSPASVLGNRRARAVSTWQARIIQPMRAWSGPLVLVRCTCWQPPQQHGNGKDDLLLDWRLGMGSTFLYYNIILVSRKGGESNQPLPGRLIKKNQVHNPKKHHNILVHTLIHSPHRIRAYLTLVRPTSLLTSLQKRNTYLIIIKRASLWI
jgi:hypothetical protein